MAAAIHAHKAADVKHNHEEAEGKTQAELLAEKAALFSMALGSVHSQLSMQHSCKWSVVLS